MQYIVKCTLCNFLVYGRNRIWKLTTPVGIQEVPVANLCYSDTLHGFSQFLQVNADIS
jgi:hypothetical protein